MNIKLPKDAEGREIPLDTVVLFDKDGQEIEVLRYQYYPKEVPDYWNIKAVRNKFYRQDEVYLTPPDSWEKLEEDLRRTKGKSDAICAYFGCDNSDCVACRLNKESFKAIPYCNPCLAFKDILDRIRKLRGES